MLSESLEIGFVLIFRGLRNSSSFSTTKNGTIAFTEADTCERSGDWIDYTKSMVRISRVFCTFDLRKI